MVATGSLETEIKLKTADIVANFNVKAAAVAEMSLFHLIFISVFTLHLIKIVFSAFLIIIIVTWWQQLACRQRYN